jgi:hypothetical protein
MIERIILLAKKSELQNTPGFMTAVGTKQTFQPMWIYVCFRG